MNAGTVWHAGLFFVGGAPIALAAVVLTVLLLAVGSVVSRAASGLVARGVAPATTIFFREAGIVFAFSPARRTRGLRPIEARVVGTGSGNIAST